MTDDGTRQFAADERGVLREMPVQKKATKQLSHSKAAIRIKITADNLDDVLESDAWEATTFAFYADGTAVEVDKAAA